MSELISKLRSEMFQAIKEKNQDVSGIIQLTLSSIKNREIDIEESLSDDEIIDTIRKETKKLQDSIDQFSAAGEETLLRVSINQKAYLDSYLPLLMDLESVQSHVQKVIEETGASSKRELGMVMGKVMSDLKGKADGAMVKDVVNSMLQ